MTRIFEQVGFREVKEEMQTGFQKVDEKLEHIDDVLEVISVMAKTNEIEHRDFDHRLKKIEANI